MQYTAQDIKQIEDFQKYARFLCEHFDISVELDSTQAKTDGKVINLPNVVGLNEEELDMMYSILLHEVGHIKYSHFGEDYFRQLKSEHHAYLANAIEDARIENRLIKEFAGAKEMFVNLYTVHVIDPNKMKRLFKIDNNKNPDIFSSMAIAIHNKLVKFDTAPLSTYTTARNVKKIEAFFSNNDIDNLLLNSRLRNYKDVLALTNTIYDLFVNFYKDKSKKLEFEKSLQEKKELVKALNELNKITKEKEDEILNTQSEIKSLQEDKAQWEKINLENLAKLKNQIESLFEINKKNSDLISKRNKIIKMKTQFENREKSINRNENKIQELHKNLVENEPLLHSGKNEVGKEFTEKQLESLSKKIDSWKETINRLKSRISSDKEKSKDIQKEHEKLLDELSIEDRNVDMETLQEKVGEIKKEMEHLNEKLSPLEKAYKDLTDSILNLESKKNEIIKNLKDHVISQLYDLESKGNDLDVPVALLPDFIETPGWPEADKVQKEMDKDISKERKEPVRNGVRVASMFGSNIRDISVYLDSKKEQVKEIDLLEVFKEKTDFSLLPNLNERSQITKYTTDKSILSDWTSLEKHTVLTTQFDMVKQDNISKDINEYNKSIKDNLLIINQMKKEFLNKFKFTKKPRYRGGKEDGDLDSRSLWKLATNYSEDYFEVKNPKFINKIVASILVDISGSQNKEESAYGKKIKDLTLILSEALDSVHVNHEILGYHAPINDTMRRTQASFTYNRRSNSLETVIYKNFRQKSNSAISNIQIQTSDNSDGESVRLAVKRLKRESAKSRVLFVITDGKPFLSDSDINILDADLKSALREAVQNKVEVFAFGFALNGVDFYGDRYCYIKEWNDVIEFIKKLKF